MGIVQEIAKELEIGEGRATVPIQTTTLEELNTRLSLGMPAGNGIARDFSFRRPSIEIELRISDLKDKPEYAQYPGRHIAAILAESLATLTGESFDSLSIDQRIQKVASLPFADVVHLCIYRAWHAGKLSRQMYLEVPCHCPQCDQPIHEFSLDPSAIKIHTWNWEAGTPPRGILRLTEPIVVGDPAKDGRSTSILVFAPPSWQKATFGLTKKAFENVMRLDMSIALAGIVAGEDFNEGGFWALQPSQAFNDVAAIDGENMREVARIVGGNLLAMAPFKCHACESVLKVPIGLKDVGMDFF